jgi:peptidoglycan/LPS O-acetylase OafA/YrhL
MQKVYFPVLDSLRAVAMLLVLVGHFSAWFDHWGVSRIAVHGLTLFFVLSGFLITYLLLLEKEETGQIRVRQFYFRRILRIWPAYYLTVGIGQCLIPFTGLLGHPEVDLFIREHFWGIAKWYLLFLPNIPILLGLPLNGYIAHTWSIGVEEQFYLAWPWVIRQFRKRLPAILCSFFLLGVLSCLAYVFVFPAWRDSRGFLHLLGSINDYLYASNISYFSLGAGIAFIRLKRPRIVRVLANRGIQWGTLLVCLLMVVPMSPAGELILGITFSLLILHATLDGSLVSRLRSPLLLYLGKISYSMYLFHLFTLLTVGRIIRMLGDRPWPPLVNPLTEFALGLGLTVLVGGLSYRYVESFFLRWKKRIDPYRSGPEV